SIDVSGRSVRRGWARTSLEQRRGRGRTRPRHLSGAHRSRLLRGPQPADSTSKQFVQSLELALLARLISSSTSALSSVRWHKAGSSQREEHNSEIVPRVAKAANLSTT